MTIKEIVYEVLLTNVASRDNDPLLYVLVADQLELNNLPPYALLTALPYQTIRATRQNIQMKNPHLRGEFYEDRQKHWWTLKKKYSPTYLDKLQLWRQSV